MLFHAALHAHTELAPSVCFPTPIPNGRCKGTPCRPPVRRSWGLCSPQVTLVAMRPNDGKSHAARSEGQAGSPFAPQGGLLFASTIPSPPSMSLQHGSQSEQQAPRSRLDSMDLVRIFPRPAHPGVQRANLLRSGAEFCFCVAPFLCFRGVRPRGANPLPKGYSHHMPPDRGQTALPIQQRSGPYH